MNLYMRANLGLQDQSVRVSFGGCFCNNSPRLFVMQFSSKSRAWLAWSKTAVSYYIGKMQNFSLEPIMYSKQVSVSPW